MACRFGLFCGLCCFELTQFWEVVLIVWMGLSLRRLVGFSLGVRYFGLV